MEFAPAQALQALADLLAPTPREGEGEADWDGQRRQAPVLGSVTPGDIGGGGEGPKPPAAAAPDMKSGNSKEIWSAMEVPEGCGYEDAWDARELPEYEILFKQQVGAEDIFLGLSRKDPSTACCEDMLVKIQLPDTKVSDIVLDIQEKVLDLRTPQKKLLLPLPEPVDAKCGKARFFTGSCVLEVALKMKREFDFINFS